MWATWIIPRKIDVSAGFIAPEEFVGNPKEDLGAMDARSFHPHWRDGAAHMKFPPTLVGLISVAARLSRDKYSSDKKHQTMGKWGAPKHS